MNQELRDKIDATLQEHLGDLDIELNYLVNSLYQLVVESQIKELKRLQSSYDSEIGWDIGDRLTQLQSQLSSIGESK